MLSRMVRSCYFGDCVGGLVVVLAKDELMVE